MAAQTWSANVAKHIASLNDFPFDDLKNIESLNITLVPISLENKIISWIQNYKNICNAYLNDVKPSLINYKDVQVSILTLLAHNHFFHRLIQALQKCYSINKNYQKQLSPDNMHDILIQEFNLLL